MRSPLQEPRATPPVEPGSGPFNVKGTAYVGHLAWTREHFPGGLHAFRAALSPAMRTFFDQPFLVMSQYDLFPLISAGVVCARELRVGFHDFVAERSRDQATRDMNGLYRLLLRLASPRLICARLPTLMGQYFEFLETNLLESEEQRARFEIKGVPTLAVEWLHGVYEGYSQVVLRATGVTSARLEMTVTPTGRLRSYEVNRVVGEIAWS